LKMLRTQSSNTCDWFSLTRSVTSEMLDTACTCLIRQY
jgi:hypothetical protein